MVQSASRTFSCAPKLAIRLVGQGIVGRDAATVASNTGSSLVSSINLATPIRCNTGFRFVPERREAHVGSSLISCLLARREQRVTRTEFGEHPLFLGDVVP